MEATSWSCCVCAVVLDWAGTIVDYGSLAPVEVFRTVFEMRGVPITIQQARAPMGKAKKEHIAAIFRDSDVRKRWEEKFGSPPNDQDVESMYRSFLPLQKEVILRYSDAIPGARDALAQLRQKGIAIGSSTGYTRELMDHLLPTVRAQGIDPDVVICSDDVRAGRPKPWMIYEALQRLDRTPVWRTVVVDDTTAGVEAGLHAGCWTVAVSRSGNELGLSLEDAEAVSPDRMNQILADIKNRFLQQGADIVIETVSELPSAIAEIESRMKRGCLPRALNTMQ